MFSALTLIHTILYKFMYFYFYNKKFFYKPCNGINIINVTIPNNEDTPISCHSNKMTKIIPKGPIHKKFKNLIAMSNRFTSFDSKFATWPIVVSPREYLLNRNA